MSKKNLLKKISLSMGADWKLSILEKNHTYLFNPTTKEKIYCIISSEKWGFGTCLPSGYSGKSNNSIGCSSKKSASIIAKDIKKRLLSAEYIEDIKNAKLYFEKKQNMKKELFHIENALSKVCEISGGYHHRFSNPLYLTCKNSKVELDIDLDPEQVTLKTRTKISIECLFEIINLLDQDKYR
jgi:hypothetical protein